MTLDLAVIIVSWNTRDALLSCLESVFKQGDGFTCEVLVVDNGSKDGSPEEVRKRYPKVTLMENSSNQGFARANNQAIRSTSSWYCLLLNSDTELTPQALKEMIGFMEKNPSASGALKTRVPFWTLSLAEALKAAVKTSWKSGNSLCISIIIASMNVSIGSSKAVYATSATCRLA